MAATITIDEIDAECPNTATDLVKNGIISFLTGADQCFDNNGVPEDEQKMLKLLAACHMLVMQSGGQLTSERDMDGASVSYSDKAYGKGLNSTMYGQSLQQMDAYGCITSIILPQRFVRAVG